MNTTTISIALSMLLLGAIIGRFSASNSMETAAHTVTTNGTENSVEADSELSEQRNINLFTLPSDPNHAVQTEVDETKVHNESAYQDVSKTEVSDRLKDISYAGGFSSLLEIYQMSKQLPKSDIKDLLHEFAKAPAENYLQLGMLMDVLFEDDPKSGVEFVSQTFGKQQKNLLSQAVANWAKESPYEAYQYVVDNNLTGYRASREIFKQLASQESAEQLTDMLLNLNNANGSFNNNTYSAIFGLVKGIEDEQKLIDIYLNLSATDNISGQYLEQYKQSWIREDFGHYSQSVDSGLIDAPEISNFRTASSMMYSAGNNELEQRANWILSYTPDNKRDSIVSSLAETMATKGDGNDYIAMSWLDSIDNIDLEQAKIRVISSLSYRQPDIAINHLEQLSTDEARQKASARIYAQLRRNDPQGATVFLNQSPYKSHIEKDQNERERKRKEREKRVKQ